MESFPSESDNLLGNISLADQSGLGGKFTTVVRYSIRCTLLFVPLLLVLLVLVLPLPPYLLISPLLLLCLFLLLAHLFTPQVRGLPSEGLSRVRVDCDQQGRPSLGRA